MQITKNQLRQIIKEELASVIGEGPPGFTLRQRELEPGETPPKPTPESLALQFGLSADDAAAMQDFLDKKEAEKIAAEQPTHGNEPKWWPHSTEEEKPQIAKESRRRKARKR